MNHNITDDKLWNLNRIDSEKSNVFGGTHFGNFFCAPGRKTKTKPKS